jgi:hypothetical protein
MPVRKSMQGVFVSHAGGPAFSVFACDCGPSPRRASLIKAPRDYARRAETDNGKNSASSDRADRASAGLARSDAAVCRSAHMIAPFGDCKPRKRVQAL